jgi:NAD kinase
MSAQDARILLVHRRTRLEELVARHNTVEQARFAVERLEGDFGDYVKEDARYREALTRAEAALKSLGRVQRLERDFLPNYLFGRDDLVVVVGQDGLVANTLKYLDGQSVLALNPDPTRYEGVLLPFALADLPRVAAEALAGRRPASEITMVEARLNDGQRLQAVNDLFLGPRRHTTASYVLAFGDYRDLQMSSGLIVATGLGSTGWLRSILEGAVFLAAAAGRRFDTAELTADLRWESRFLLFAVREPYAGGAGTAGPVFGRIDAQTPLRLESRMAEEGVIFSDGMLDDAVPFNAGAQVEIGLAARCGRLLT